MKKLLQDTRGQLFEFEVLGSPGFLILAALAVGATLMGWKLSLGMDYHYSFIEVALLIAFEIVACYVIALKMFD